MEMTYPPIIIRNSDGAIFLRQKDFQYMLSFEAWTGVDIGECIQRYSRESLDDDAFSTNMQEFLTQWHPHDNTLQDS